MNAKDFYIKSTTSSYCEPCDKIFYLKQINNADENFITFAQNLTAGTLNVTSNIALSPIPAEDIEYVVYYDDKFVNSDNYSVVDGEINLLLSDLEKFGSSIVSHVDIIVRYKNQSKGVKYSQVLNRYDVSAIQVSKSGEIYTIIDTISTIDSISYLDWGSYTFIWSIDDKVLPCNTYSCEAKDNLLALYTDKEAATLKVKILEIPNFSYETKVNIERNGYKISVEFEDVINGVSFYKNISVSHNAPAGLFIKNFIDGTLLSDTHFDAIDNAGKTLITVLTTDDTMTTFDVNNINTYESYIVTDIDYINTDIYTKMMLDTNIDGTLYNSTNNGRELKINKSFNNDFNNYLNYKFYDFNTDDKEYYIKQYENGQHIGNEREGLIYKDVSTNEINVFNHTITPMVVTDDKILDKYEVTINNSSTNIIPSTTEFNLFFDGDESKIIDNDGWMMLESIGSEDYSAVIEDNYRLQQVEFSVQYIGNSDDSSRMTMSLYDKNELLIGRYGLERTTVGVTISIDENKIVTFRTQESFESFLLIRVTSSKLTHRIVVSFNKASNDIMGIKNIVLTGEK